MHRRAKKMKKNYLSPELNMILKLDDVITMSTAIIENDDLGESPEWF